MHTDDEILLSARAIEKSFGGVQVLKKVNFDIKRGEIHALIGENGAGKSTLIKILTGAYQKDSGTIFYNGKEVELNSRQDAIKLGIAVIYQELSLIPTLNVSQNIFLGREIVKNGILDKKSMREKVISIMKFYGLFVDPDAVIETLSVAQKQIVEILKALTFESSLIIMDEPTAPLSAVEAESLFKIIKGLKQKNVSILYISHRLEEIYQLADRITILRDGANVAVVERNQTEPAEIIKLMIGKKIVDDTDTGITQMKQNNNEVLLEVKNISSAGSFLDISFNVRKGEILGIGGLIGSGRTEVLNAIYGAKHCDSGQIIFNGKPIHSSIAENIRAGIAMIPEDRRSEGLIPLLDITRNIAAPNYDLLSWKKFWVKSRDELNLAKKAIKQLDIRPNNPQARVLNLSGGNQQKVVVGKWLMRDLKLLLIDEPTVGIDIGVKEEIYRIIKDLASRGISIILVSSDLQELLRISHRIIVLRHGTIAKEFNEGCVSQEDILKAASGITEGGIEKGGE